MLSSGIDFLQEIRKKRLSVIPHTSYTALEKSEILTHPLMSCGVVSIKFFKVDSVDTYLQYVPKEGLDLFQQEEQEFS